MNEFYKDIIFYKCKKFNSKEINDIIRKCVTNRLEHILEDYIEEIHRDISYIVDDLINERFDECLEVAYSQGFYDHEEGLKYSFGDRFEREIKRCNERIKSESYVYFISDGTNVKIGVSVNPKIRLKELQTSNPNKLEIIRVIKCDNSTIALNRESNLHKYYEKYKTYAGNEWFSNCVKYWITKMNEEKLIKISDGEITRKDKDDD